MAAEHHRSAWRYLSGRYRGWRWAPLRLALRIGLGARSAVSRVVPRIAAGAEAQRREPDPGIPADGAAGGADGGSDWSDPAA
jgi:N-acetylglucosaminyl-diphospho-decaprenol L-rhamnosyltransferase